MRYIVAEDDVKNPTSEIKIPTAGNYRNKILNHGRIYVHGFLFSKLLL